MVVIYSLCEYDSTSTLKEFCSTWAPPSNSACRNYIIIDDLDTLDILLEGNAADLIHRLHYYMNSSRPSSILAYGRDSEGIISDISRNGNAFPYGASDSQLSDLLFISAPANHENVSEMMYDAKNFIATSVVEYCKYRADISILTSKLRTGYSMDVHGQVFVHDFANGRREQLLFKIADNGILCSTLNSK